MILKFNKRSIPCDFSGQAERKGETIFSFLKIILTAGLKKPESPENRFGDAFGVDPTLVILMSNISVKCFFIFLFEMGVSSYLGKNANHLPFHPP